MSLPEAQTEEYNAFFANKSLSDLPAVDKVITVNSSDSVAQATRTLAAHNILSAPVRDSDQPDDAPWLEKYIGTADAVNLMHWLLHQVQDTDGIEDLDMLLRHTAAHTEIANVIDEDKDTARFNPFIPLAKENNTMLDVMLLLGKYAQHRAYIVEPGSDITNVVTQTSLLEFLHAHLDEFPKLVDSTVADLQLGTKKDIVSCKPTDTMQSALLKMRDEHVSALPFVDKANKVLGVVSSRDTRLLIRQPTRLRFLNQPLELFNDLHVAPFDAEVVCCTSSDTLRSVIEKLRKNRVHRVFVVDDDNVLQSVIALRDVIAQFVKEPADSKIEAYFVQRSAAAL
ncbi:uncharacterized protein MONBRDRAFT_37974 [Monosiga brevicollis MX1]|uniref:CBS domain-containing protein n=1 Tax=Monosiga brevicollis TaxID=81824 RepID=A9V4Z3_MONBE|nr:uncharacterized protein MONBRDRAFT_37974 [Monosiga brevicollis MX1]EDQ87540.1 predicted protein [Monosiga brevicollis MX1]|eukprot:XP_001747800.1 hypothetical protein [Monosiga brevicollis MX1]